MNSEVSRCLALQYLSALVSIAHSSGVLPCIFAYVRLSLRSAQDPRRSIHTREYKGRQAVLDHNRRPLFKSK